MLETGTKAPDFTLPDENGEDVALADLAGTTVVLYFYPKADTPGCTTQACGIRDHLPDYTSAGVRVLGVSPDPVKLVKKFHDQQDLNFTLLADEDHAVCEAYGVWAEKSMYGKTYMGALRATFIIDAEGTIVARHPEGVAEDARRRGAQGDRGAQRGVAGGGCARCGPDSEPQRVHPLIRSVREGAAGPGLGGHCAAPRRVGCRVRASRVSSGAPRNPYS